MLGVEKVSKNIEYNLSHVHIIFSESNIVDFIRWCDYLGTFAFAISGIRLAAAHRFDWFGAFVVGLVTAVGGGTLRDIMLDIPVFWLTEPSYLLITSLALVVTVLFRKWLVKLNNTVYFFDAVGLGLFTAVGVAKSLGSSFPWWIAPIMGTITGSFGGMIRDILINEVPLIFRRDFYAMACLTGSFIYLALLYLEVSAFWAQGISALSIVILRILAAKYHWGIPYLTPHSNE